MVISTCLSLQLYNYGFVLLDKIINLATDTDKPLSVPAKLLCAIWPEPSDQVTGGVTRCFRSVIRAATVLSIFLITVLSGYHLDVLSEGPLNDLGLGIDNCQSHLSGAQRRNRFPRLSRHRRGGDEFILAGRINSKLNGKTPR